MTEVSLAQAPRETNPIVEKLGKANIRKLAAVGLALSVLFGVGEKVNSGASIGVEVYDPTTGKQKMVGVGLSLGKGDTLGIPGPDERNLPSYKDLNTYEVEVNGTRFYAYTGSGERDKYNGVMVTILAIRPGFETDRK